MILNPHTHPFILEIHHIFHEWFQEHINIDARLLRTLDKNRQHKILSFVTQPYQNVVHHEDDRSCVVHGPVFTKWIHSIGTQSKLYISTHRSKLWILKFKKFPLSSIRRVLNLLIIFPTLLRMPAHQFRIPRVGEQMFQMIDHCKVPHHQGKKNSLHLILFIRISFGINTPRIDSSLILIFLSFSS
jgi:hypothetical protein